MRSRINSIIWDFRYLKNSAIWRISLLDTPLFWELIIFIIIQLLKFTILIKFTNPKSNFSSNKFNTIPPLITFHSFFVQIQNPICKFRLSNSQFSYSNIFSPPKTPKALKYPFRASVRAQCRVLGAKALTEGNTQSGIHEFMNWR